MNGVFGFAKNLNFADTLNVQNCANSTENCVHQMYRLSRFAENLNIQNFVIRCILDVRIALICRKLEF